MRQIFITLLLLLGLNLSAQEVKAYQLDNGTLKIEEFYSNGQLKQVSFYTGTVGVGVWLKYNEEGILVGKAKMENGRPIKLFRYEDGVTTIIDRKKNSITKIKQ